MNGWQGGNGGWGRPRAGAPARDEAMSTEDFISEMFENERRERVPDGHELMEHLKDEEFSKEDVVGVTFGNRQTLQRLYDQGRVKPEGDAAFRAALGLPPKAQDPGASARLLSAHGGQGAAVTGGAQTPSPVPDPHEEWRLQQKQGQPAPQAGGGGDPRSIAKFDRDVGDALGTVARKTKDTLLDEDFQGKVADAGRVAWEVMKWDAIETGRQVFDNVAKASKVAGELASGKDPIWAVVDSRRERVKDARRRADSLKGEIRELVEDINRVKKRR